MYYNSFKINTCKFYALFSCGISFQITIIRCDYPRVSREKNQITCCHNINLDNMVTSWVACPIQGLAGDSLNDAKSWFMVVTFCVLGINLVIHIPIASCMVQSWAQQVTSEGAWAPSVLCNSGGGSNFHDASSSAKAVGSCGKEALADCCWEVPSTCKSITGPLRIPQVACCGWPRTTQSHVMLIHLLFTNSFWLSYQPVHLWSISATSPSPCWCRYFRLKDSSIWFKWVLGNESKLAS